MRLWDLLELFSWWGLHAGWMTGDNVDFLCRHKVRAVGDGAAGRAPWSHRFSRLHRCASSRAALPLPSHSALRTHRGVCACELTAADTVAPSVFVALLHPPPCRCLPVGPVGRASPGRVQVLPYDQALAKYWWKTFQFWKYLIDTLLCVRKLVRLAPLASPPSPHLLGPAEPECHVLAGVSATLCSTHRARRGVTVFVGAGRLVPRGSRRAADHAALQAAGARWEKRRSAALRADLLLRQIRAKTLGQSLPRLPAPSRPWSPLCFRQARCVSLSLSLGCSLRCGAGFRPCCPGLPRDEPRLTRPLPSAGTRWHIWSAGNGRWGARFLPGVGEVRSNVRGACRLALRARATWTRVPMRTRPLEGLLIPKASCYSRHSFLLVDSAGALQTADYAAPRAVRALLLVAEEGGAQRRSAPPKGHIRGAHPAPAPN